MAEDDEGGGKEEVEVDDMAELLSAASEFAVAIHPTVRSLHDPARTGLDRGRHAFTGDGAIEAERVEQRTRHVAIVAAIQVDGDVVGQAVQFVQAGERGSEQWAIVAVGSSRDDMERVAILIEM